MENVCVPIHRTLAIHVEPSADRSVLCPLTPLNPTAFDQCLLLLLLLLCFPGGAFNSVGDR